MAYYVFVDVDIFEPEGYLEYMGQMKPAVEAAGGRFLARGGHFKVLEGELDLHRILLLEFPSQHAWDEFYNSEVYAPLRMIRHASAETLMFGFAGM